MFVCQFYWAHVSILAECCHILVHIVPLCTLTEQAAASAEEWSAEIACWPVEGWAALCAWQSEPLTHRPEVWPGPNPILASALRPSCYSGFKTTDQQEPYRCSHPCPFPQTIKDWMPTPQDTHVHRCCLTAAGFYGRKKQQIREMGETYVIYQK